MPGLMPKGPLGQAVSVYPSGGAFFAASVPTMPPAPGLFSTTNVWPIDFENWSAVTRAMMSVADPGVKATMTAEGVGHATGDSLKNPVTGEPHQAQIVLPDGFIWTMGECGVGTFQVEAEGVRLDYTDTNWIYYEFDWSNN